MAVHAPNVADSSALPWQAYIHHHQWAHMHVPGQIALHVPLAGLSPNVDHTWLELHLRLPVWAKLYYGRHSKYAEYRFKAFTAGYLEIHGHLDDR